LQRNGGEEAWLLGVTKGNNSLLLREIIYRLFRILVLLAEM
jgi:hypothetical protein